jgi:predicted phage terminase large subunit-like protein
MNFEPQKGAQENFLSTPADFAIYGGQAGGGKTWALLFEPIKHVKVPDFGAVIFRRTMPQITNEGGLWDESQKMYPYAGGVPRQSPKLDWRFGGTPSKPTSKVTFSQMQYENNCYDWQGSQIPLILMDELTHFTEKQIFYMLSRNRSMCGVRPYFRATCNPDPDHITRELVDWYVDNDTGLPIHERAGMLRYFVRMDETLYWADSAQELIEKFGADCKPLSFTFIPASLADNPALLRADPDYVAKLQALPLIERERLLGGNWNISSNDGIVNREWVIIVNSVPKEHEVIRYRWSWDTASKDKTVNDPTCGTFWAETTNGHYLLDIYKDRVRYPDLKKVIQDKQAERPAHEILIEDKSSGIALIQDLQNSTQLPIVACEPGTKDKVERLSLASTWFETRNVYFWQGCPYLQECINELVNFKGSGSTAHDDFVDTVSQYLLRVGEGEGLGFSKSTLNDINSAEDVNLIEKKEW